MLEPQLWNFLPKKGFPRNTRMTHNLPAFQPLKILSSVSQNLLILLFYSANELILCCCFYIILLFYRQYFIVIGFMDIDLLAALGSFYEDS